jgi:hypothetical protein
VGANVELEELVEPADALADLTVDELLAVALGE